MNFKRYNESDNSWTDSHYIMGTDTDTITTLPTVIYPNDTSITVGLKGNEEHTGTPTPQNPVMPEGTGERTAQLYFKKIVGGSIGADGGIVENVSFDCYVAKVEANKQYIGTGYVYAFYTSEPALGSVSYNRQRVAASVANGFTSPIDGYVAVRHNAGVTNAMLNTGSTALPYEPYGYKIPILSANTTTPVYLGEVQTTRKIKKYEFTGQETGWNYSTSGDRTRAYIALADSLGASLCICSHYAYVRSSISYPIIDEFTLNSSGSILIGIDSTIYTDVTDFKTYLQQQYANGTPVTVWYVLATPTTGIVNEPLRKIGDYADSVSGITIPTIAGANAVDVLTTLKPSEVTVNYKGWHPVSSVHERDNGAWT